MPHHHPGTPFRALVSAKLSVWGPAIKLRLVALALPLTLHHSIPLCPIPPPSLSLLPPPPLLSPPRPPHSWAPLQLESRRWERRKWPSLWTGRESRHSFRLEIKGNERPLGEKAQEEETELKLGHRQGKCSRGLASYGGIRLYNQHVQSLQSAVQMPQQICLGWIPALPLFGSGILICVQPFWVLVSLCQADDSQHEGPGIFRGQEADLSLGGVLLGLDNLVAMNP